MRRSFYISDAPPGRNERRMAAEKARRRRSAPITKMRQTQIFLASA
jgi:hypothetical protein